jgi:hypothetical protein
MWSSALSPCAFPLEVAASMLSGGAVARLRVVTAAAMISSITSRLAIVDVGAMVLLEATAAASACAKFTGTMDVSVRDVLQEFVHIVRAGVTLLFRPRESMRRAIVDPFTKIDLMQ